MLLKTIATQTHTPNVTNNSFARKDMKNAKTSSGEKGKTSWSEERCFDNMLHKQKKFIRVLQENAFSQSPIKC